MLLKPVSFNYTPVYDISSNDLDSSLHQEEGRLGCQMDPRQELHLCPTSRRFRRC